MNSFGQNDLSGEWFLHAITKNEIQELNTFNPTFQINFTSDPMEDDLYFGGMAICKDYFGGYNLVDESTFEMINLSFTLDMCQETGGTYEDSYLSFFAEAQTGKMSLTYNITVNAEDVSLIVTRQNGDFVVYGRQSLSVEAQEINNLSIQFIENPVKNFMKLKIGQTLGNDFNYDIFSIDEKHILKAKLNDNQNINVETLDAGIYFLTISSENNYTQTLKFIKK